MLFEYLQLAAHPRVADGAIQRRDRVEHEPLQPLSHQQVSEHVLQRPRIVRLQYREHVALEYRR